MANFYKQLFRGKKIDVLRQQAVLAKRKAEYLASPKGLAKETIKGMPASAVKIGKGIREKMRYFLGGGEYGRRQNIKTKERMKIWEKEKSKRGIK